MATLEIRPAETPKPKYVPMDIVIDGKVVGEVAPTDGHEHDGARWNACIRLGLLLPEFADHRNPVGLCSLAQGLGDDQRSAIANALNIYAANSVIMVQTSEKLNRAFGHLPIDDAMQRIGQAPAAIGPVPASERLASAKADLLEMRVCKLKQEDDASQAKSDQEQKEKDRLYLQRYQTLRRAQCIIDDLLRVKTPESMNAVLVNAKLVRNMISKDLEEERIDIGSHIADQDSDSRIQVLLAVCNKLKDFEGLFPGQDGQNNPNDPMEFDDYKFNVEIIRNQAIAAIEAVTDVNATKPMAESLAEQTMHVQMSSELLDAIDALIACPDLNLDDLDHATHEAIGKAVAAKNKWREIAGLLQTQQSGLTSAIQQTARFLPLLDQAQSVIWAFLHPNKDSMVAQDQMHDAKDVLAKLNELLSKVAKIESVTIKG